MLCVYLACNRGAGDVVVEVDDLTVLVGVHGGISNALNGGGSRHLPVTSSCPTLMMVPSQKLIVSDEGVPLILNGRCMIYRPLSLG